MRCKKTEMIPQATRNAIIKKYTDDAKQHSQLLATWYMNVQEMLIKANLNEKWRVKMEALIFETNTARIKVCNCMIDLVIA